MQNERIIDTPTGKVGYLTFNTHNNVAERQLIDTMRRFQAAGVSDEHWWSSQLHAYHWAIQVGRNV